MGRRHDLHQAFLACSRKSLHVAFQHRLERLGRRPVRVLRRQRLHPVEREGELGVHRVLDPQRAVIVEHGNTFGFGHEIG